MIWEIDKRSERRGSDKKVKERREARPMKGWR